MTLPSLFVLLSLVLHGATPAIFAQSQEGDPFVRCTRCKNMGAKPCKTHDSDDCELEGNAMYCSVMGQCESCGGTGWVDCRHCENEAVRKRLDARRAEIPALAAGVAHYEEDMGKELMLAESPHFVVIWDIERIKVGKRVKGGHEMLHRYVDYLEELYTDYTAILGVPDRHFKRKSRVFIWARQQDHRDASSRYCRMSSQGGVRLMGAHPTYSVAATKELFGTEEFLRRNIIHCAAHLLLSHQQPIHWIGKSKGGWADAGLAHWFEDRYFEICDNYCYMESDTAGGVKSGAWKPAVRKMVNKKATPSLAGLFQQNTETLTPEQHMVAFSLMDYLLQLDPKKTNELLVQLRLKVSTRDALGKTFDINPIKLEEAWLAWVRETYPSR